MFPRPELEYFCKTQFWIKLFSGLEMIIEWKVRKLILTCNLLALLYFVSWFAHHWHTNMYLPIPRDNGLGKIYTHRKTQGECHNICLNSAAGKETVLIQVCPDRRVLFRHTGLADVSFKKRVWGCVPQYFLS